jgi:hypothetical protein
MSDAAPISTGSTGTTTQPDLSSAGGPTGVQGGAAVPQGLASVPNGATSVDWSSSLPEPQKAYLAKKGFKDPGSILDSYEKLETLMGTPKERLLRLPDKPDAPEWGDIYDRLGRPKNANEYQFGKPGAEPVNKEFTDWAQKLFHSQGLTKQQGETLAARWNEYAIGDVQKQQEAYAANLKVEQTALQKEWGAAYDQKIKGCQAAAQAFGLGREEVAKLEKALGYSATLKFLSNVGEKLSEDSFIGAENGASGFKGALTPAAAQSEIEELKKDKDFMRRYTSGDREAFKKMTALHQAAHPDIPQD